MNALLYGVNRPRSWDPVEMSDAEKKHHVDVDVLSFDEEKQLARVRVEVGKYLKHPNEPSHFIQWIELCVDDTPAVRVDFTASLAHPSVEVLVHATPSSTIFAKARCNLHGTWMSKRISVQ